MKDQEEQQHKPLETIELERLRKFEETLKSLSSGSSVISLNPDDTITGIRNLKLHFHKDITNGIIPRSAIERLDKQSETNLELNYCIAIIKYKRKLISYEETCERLGEKAKPTRYKHNMALINRIGGEHIDLPREIEGLLIKWLKSEKVTREQFELDQSKTKEFYNECFKELIAVDRRYSYEKILYKTINVTVLDAAEEIDTKKSCLERMCIVS